MDKLAARSLGSDEVEGQAILINRKAGQHALDPADDFVINPQNAKLWGAYGHVPVFHIHNAGPTGVNELVSSLSGANLIHDVGYVEYGSTSCFEQVVVMDELAGEIRFILEGKVSKETLALEVIDRVGPGGEYVTSDYTYRHFRDGWFPTLVGDRHTHEGWVQRGSKTLGDATKAKIEALIVGAEQKAGVEAE